MSMPARTNSNWRLASLPTSSVMRSRSRVTICEAFATESRGKPVDLAERSTLPGASAQTRLLVNGTQTTVRIPLRFSVSPWTTTTGLRNPGPEPVGSGRSAQYTWPWTITIRRLRACVVPQLLTLGQARDVFSYRFRVNLTARFFQATGQAFRLRVNLIGNGDRRFHTQSITGCLAARKRPGRKSTVKGTG